MRHFRRHANGFAKGWMRLDGFANVHAVRTHLNGQGNLANHVARMGADHATAQDLAVAPASMAVSKSNIARRYRLLSVLNQSQGRLLALMTTIMALTAPYKRKESNGSH